MPKKRKRVSEEVGARAAEHVYQDGRRRGRFLPSLRNCTDNAPLQLNRLFYLCEVGQQPLVEGHLPPMHVHVAHLFGAEEGDESLAAQPNANRISCIVPRASLPNHRRHHHLFAEEEEVQRS